MIICHFRACCTRLCFEHVFFIVYISIYDILYYRRFFSYFLYQFFFLISVLCHHAFIYKCGAQYYYKKLEWLQTVLMDSLGWFTCHDCHRCASSLPFIFYCYKINVLWIRLCFYVINGRWQRQQCVNSNKRA